MNQIESWIKNIRPSFKESLAGIWYGSHIKSLQINMEKRNLTPFNVLLGVNPILFSQLCLYHYAEIAKEHDYGVWSVYHQTDKNDMSPRKSAPLAKKKSNHFLLGKMD